MHRQSDLRSAAEAALILVIGMGFGRFAFTALYPLMVQEGVLTLQGGSLAASANYAGYLLGALLLMWTRSHRAHLLCVVAMLGTSAGLAALAVVTATWGIVVVRLLAGVLSAVAMVAGSLWLFEHRRQFAGAPLLYAGVGLGIAVSAELLVVGGAFGLHSAGLWLLLGVVCFALSLLALPGLLLDRAVVAAAPGMASGHSAAPVAAWPLVVLYGLAGLGYIVTATYLPVLVRDSFPDLNAAHVWAVFGLGAAPSCFVWHRVHQRLGSRAALRVNLLIQAVGVALPAMLPTTTGFLLSALLVGGTFMGTVTIAMPAAQQAARHAKINLMAVMTLAYGVGQIAGPLMADRLHTLFLSFNGALLAAAAALILAALLTLRL
ncbi:MAG: YbfB/YjiJ family MFS transporter [Pseudomonas sp.]|uniref:YbfB/YjiJ family MFS transporter n=1 Tax=Pseudomonas sp. TaxID=306 RepID=UPI0032428651